jgi:PIN domain nuclease of toxin-antitoxin system
MPILLDTHIVIWLAAEPDLKAIELPLTRAHLQEFRRLQPRHKDPFDHLLMSQALAEDAEFASTDAEIGKYQADGVRIVR